jgi:hypothetical protein
MVGMGLDSAMFNNMRKIMVLEKFSSAKKDSGYRESTMKK